MPVGKNGERLEREKMHTMRGSKDLNSRILGGIGKGGEGHENKKKYPIPITDHGHGEKHKTRLTCFVVK